MTASALAPQGSAPAPAARPSVLRGEGIELAGDPARRMRLADCAIELVAGQVAAVVGPNGAGKSSLLAVLAGLARPTRGSVRLDGAPIAAMSRARLAQAVALVGPWTLPDVDLTVREVVSLGRLPHRTSIWQDPVQAGGREVARALEVTSLEALAGVPLRRLSAGERQRARLAAAIAQGARFLLLDEPTASLDPGHARQALEIIVTLAQAGHGVGVVLHDLTAAGQCADVVHLMSEGRVVRSGAPTDALRREALEAVYRTPIEVLVHPQTGRPVVVGGFAPGR